VLVHHFGEASFGSLVPTGEHARLFETNRRVFEEKWGVAWSHHTRRQSDAYLRLVTRVRDIVVETVPPGSKVLVVSKGDDELCTSGPSKATHSAARWLIANNIH
jgi:hypothetical protein